MSDDVRISYSARELLERLETKVDTGFKEVKESIAEVSGRVTTLELERHSRSTMREGLKGWVASGSAIVLSVGSIVTMLTMKASGHG